VTVLVGVTAVAACRPANDDDTGVVAVDRRTTAAPDRAVDRAVAPGPGGADRPRRPSIVLVVMDDFSLDLLDTMRSAATMRRRGASYENAFVVDSLCCVSRTSLLTGQYPFQTGVLTNTANLPNPHGPVGGWAAFTAYGNAGRSFPVRLQRAGYTTGLVGKYINQYVPDGRTGSGPPPGWDDWRIVLGSAYAGWNFQSTRLEDGRVVLVDHPAPPAGASDAEKDAAYAGTVTQRLALGFIREHRNDDAPYVLVVAPYAPHAITPGMPHAYPGDPMFPPAFRDRPGAGRGGGNCGLVRCGRLRVDRVVGLHDDQSDNVPLRSDGSRARGWRPGLGLAARDAVRSMRGRARMVQSVDRMMTRILHAVGPETYVVLTSDNGFHLGQYGLGRGKSTPYDPDVHVPLLVTGPGVVPGPRTELTSNIDLAPTIEDLAGLAPAPYRAGVSLVPTFADRGLDRRDHVFVEHTWAPSLGFDPDWWYSGRENDAVPSYVAVRTRHALLVRLDLDDSWEGTDVAWEYYDYRVSRFERTNAFADPRHAAEVARLRGLVDRFVSCRARAAHRSRGAALPERCAALGGARLTGP
jgi:arylsulfatase A-like enzyme